MMPKRESGKGGSYKNPHFYLSLDMSFEGGLARIGCLQPPVSGYPMADTWKLYNKQVFQLESCITQGAVE